MGTEPTEQHDFKSLTANTGAWPAEEKNQNVFHSPVTRKNGRISARLCVRSQGEMPQQDKLQTFQFKDRRWQWQHVEMKLKSSRAGM